MNEGSGGNRIPVELFQILKDDAVQVLHSICQQISRGSSQPGLNAGLPHCRQILYQLSHKGSPRTLEKEMAARFSLLAWRTFSSPVATAEFSKFAGILSAALAQHHLSGFEIAKLEFHHLY